MSILLDIVTKQWACRTVDERVISYACNVRYISIYIWV